MAKLDEIKIKSDWLKPYDINDNGTFDSKELEVVPAEDIALSIQFLDESEKKKAYSVIAPLPAFKLSRVFQSGVSNELIQNWFAKLASDNPDKAAEILLNIKENPFESGGLQGLDASLLLKKTDGKIRERVLEIVKKRDAVYHREILAIPQKVKGGSSDVLGAPTPERSPDYPKPILLRLPEIKDPSQAIYAEQHEYAITNPKHARYIQTSGAFPCVILVLYDPKSKMGTIAHLDGSLKLEDSIDIILHDMQFNGAHINSVQARLYGGEATSTESPKTIYRLRAYLKSRSMPIVEQSILPQPQIRGTAITFDTEIGRAFADEETYQGLERTPTEVTLRNTQYNLVVRREKTSFGKAPFKSEPQQARIDYIRRYNPTLREFR